MKDTYISTQFELWLKLKAITYHSLWTERFLGGSRYLGWGNMDLLHVSLYENRLFNEQSSSNTLCKSILPTDHFLKVKRSKEKLNVRKTNWPPVFNFFHYSIFLPQGHVLGMQLLHTQQWNNPKMWNSQVLLSDNHCPALYWPAAVKCRSARMEFSPFTK